MSVLRRLVGGNEERGEGTPAGWPSIQTLDDLARVVSDGSASTPDGALRHPYVMRAVTKIGNTVSTLPWHVYEGNTRIDPTPDLLRRPSTTHRSIAWRFAAVESLLLGGSVCCWVQADNRQRPTSLDLLDPHTVTWTEADGWKISGVKVKEWPLGPLLHIPMYTFGSSPKGRSVIEFNAEVVNAGLIARKYGMNFLKSGGSPSAILAPETDPGPEGAEEVKRAVMNAQRRGGPVVLPQHIKYQALQISPKDTMYLELIGSNAAETAAMFGLQPEAVGAPVLKGGNSMEYSNREARQRDYLDDAGVPVLSRLEEGVDEVLPKGQHNKFNVDGLLRADLITRYQSYEISARVEELTGRPILTSPEIRELENREPLPDAADDTEEGRSLSVAEVVQKVYLGVGVVITPDEARQIINAAGGTLDVPGPDLGASE